MSPWFLFDLSPITIFMIGDSVTKCQTKAWNQTKMIDLELKLALELIFCLEIWKSYSFSLNFRFVSPDHFRAQKIMSRSHARKIKIIFHIASRIHISWSCRDNLIAADEGFHIKERGKVELKGKSTELWFFVESQYRFLSDFKPQKRVNEMCFRYTTFRFEDFELLARTNQKTARNLQCEKLSQKISQMTLA